MSSVITVKITGPQGSGKSLLARAIYAAAKPLRLTVIVASSNDGKTFHVEEER